MSADYRYYTPAGRERREPNLLEPRLDEIRRRFKALGAGAPSLALRRSQSKEEHAAIQQANEENRLKRVHMEQFRWPSAGCVFKNDYAFGVPSGKLIDEAGLKGMRIGGAAIFERHANFIINYDNACAEDVCKLIAHIKNVIFEKHGLLLEEEITYLGFA